jgi:hypothetical protein
VKIEKKLIASCVLALLIGVSSVIPILLSMSGTAKAETGPEPWFSINIPYAYWVTSDGPLDYNYSIPFPSSMNETNSVSEQHMIALNLTLTGDPKEQPVDAQVELYRIVVSSDKELIETINWEVVTNSNSSFNVTDLLSSFHFMRNDWFDTDTFDPMKLGGGGGLTRQNWTLGLSILFPEGGSGSGTVGSSSTSRVVSALREAETIAISIYRIGIVTLSGNSTVVTLANNELVNQIELEKFGEEGWLYNNLVPEDELATVNLLRPVPFEDY